MLQSTTPKKPKHARAKGGLKKHAKGPTNRARSPRSGTKQEVVLTLLRQPEGATIAAITKVTGWQAHSVRGFLAGVVRKKLKLKLASKTADGIRVYHVVGDAPSRERGPQSKRRTA